MKPYFECKYCYKKFTSEHHFKKHECVQMKRHAFLKTNVGRSAYDLFRTWCAKRHITNDDVEQFVDSRNFNAFVRFARFATKMAIPGRERFIEHMVKMDIGPVHWDKPIIYDHYMEVFDDLFSPEEQAELSVETIHELARIFECEPEHVFIHLEAHSLIKIVQAKKLSPWFLMFSSKFFRFMRDEMTREQRVLLQQYLQPDKWKAIFKSQPTTVKKMAAYVESVGL